MSEQNYQPYRSILLSKSELGDLNKLRPFYAYWSISWLWLQIIASWVAAAVIDEWWMILLCSLWIGNRYYSLFIIGHDGLHRRLHPKIQINDLINDCFILGAIGAITRINRSNHMTHHSSLASETDPDAFKYAQRKDRSKVWYAMSFTGAPFVARAVRNVFFGVPHTAVHTRERYRSRDFIVLAGWQFSLMFGLSFAFGWWGYLLMWWLPVYVLTYCADMARVFCEHSSDTHALALADRLVTFRSNPLERAIFAPLNMNHHVAHHLWPSIPFYNLPAATELIYKRAINLPNAVARPLLRDSYLKYLSQYYSARHSP